MKTITRTATRATPMYLLSIGYDFKVLLPASKVTQFLMMLEEAEIVKDRWLESETYLIKSGETVTVRSCNNEVLTEAEFEALSAAVKAEKEAE